MRISSFLKAINRVHLQNRLCAISHVQKTSIVQPKRYYKNFGHAEEGDPPSKMIWFGTGIFIMTLGSLRWFHESSDLFEEGEDKDKPDEERMYRVPVNIK